MNTAARILLVDDNPAILEPTAGFLRSAGYEVMEASTGEDCLRLAREWRPDLILLDVVLSDLSGVEVCRRIKEDDQTAALFVVLLSHFQVSSDKQVAGLESGADGYIARPIQTRELIARVQAMLRIQRAEAALREANISLERRVAERTVELTRANAALQEEVAVRRQAEEALRCSAERLRALSLRLVEVQETERRFVARELHDEIGQVLTGLKLSLEIHALPQAPEGLRGVLGEALGLIADLTGRVRQISLNLRPQMLDDLGLLTALSWHLKRYTEQTNIRVHFKHSPLPERLPSLLETAVFRLTQEALTNVARHARVDEATVRLLVDEESVTIQIEDRGAGFDPQQALAAAASTGLSGMRERAELLGGEFTLESAPGNGTRLTVALPRLPLAALMQKD